MFKSLIKAEWWSCWNVIMPLDENLICLQKEELQLKNDGKSLFADEVYGIESCCNTRLIQHVLEEKISPLPCLEVVMTICFIVVDLGYARPTYTLKRTNLKRQKEVRHQIELIKNFSYDVVLIYENEKLCAAWSVSAKDESKHMAIMQ
jgi:hypothetical protein